MLTWTKIPMPAAGPTAYSRYQATGASGRYYSILKHGTRFRLAAGGGKYDQKVSTLADLKEVCEGLEVTLAEFGEVMMVNVKPGVTVAKGQLVTTDMIQTGPTDETPVAVQEFPVTTTCGNTLLIAATSQEEAVTFARRDGFAVRLAADTDEDDEHPDYTTPLDDDDFPLGTQQNPLPDEPGLDTVVPEYRPGTPPVPEPAEHPDHETPLAAPEPPQDAPAAVRSPNWPVDDRDALPNVLGRLTLYRDLSWRPGSVIAPVRRYSGGRRARA